MEKLYIIPDRNDIEASLALAREYGAHFEYNDFFMPDVLDDPQRIRELVAFYKSLPIDRSMHSLHGAFLDMAVHSRDSLIRKVSDQRIRQCMDIATALGVGTVIFHTNLIANFKDDFYVDGWVSMNAAYWKDLSADYPHVRICIENMFDADPDAMVRLMEQLADVPGVSACFDYAHAVVFGNDPARWLGELLPYATHLHVNDNDGRRDCHMAVGHGTLDYRAWDHAIRQLGTRPSVLVETAKVKDQIESIEYMKKNGLYPFEKKGAEHA